MLLANNGRLSTKKRTKHLYVRYFFVSDRIESGEIGTEWCSSEEMIGDFFTEPLQGEKFEAFCRIIMNHGDL